MNQNLIYNFAVVRFMPYPETEEFVNIGIVLACPQLGTFTYKIESHRRERVTGFFPEMNAELFIEGRRSFENELKRLTTGMNHETFQDQTHFQFKEKEFVQLFREIVKPRESLFWFGSVGTISATGETQTLKQLFAYYVERQFASHEKYHETIMKQRLTNVFRANELLHKYHERKFGNEQYHVNIPFVHEENNCALKAIKPLDLNKDDTTRIIEYGDKWKMRIERLREIKDFPEQMLFVVRQAKDGKKLNIALEIREEFRNLGTMTVTEDEKEKLLEFAKAI